MPGTRCAVAFCNNSLVKTRELNDRPKIIYHSFPKDPNQCKKWAHFCRRADKSFNPLTAVICSEHFANEDYERDLKAELLKITPKRVLKPNVVPSNFPYTNTINPKGCIHPRPTQSIDRDVRFKVRENKKIVETILNNEFKLHSETRDGATELNTAASESSIENLLKENIELREKITLMQSKIDFDSFQIKKLKKEKHNLQRHKFKLDLDTMKARKILKTMFTKNQISILLGMKKRVNWTSEEISLAFTLRYLSKRCYLFIKRKLKIPLPGISTLQRWASRFEINQGLLQTVFKYLEMARPSFNDRERIVVLQFDELKIKKVMEYDSKNDQILGPYSHMQVISARGLFANWKQPLYINFDTQVSKDILTTVILKLKQTGYTVKACVSDMGGGNIGLWKQLDISTKKTYFTPIPSNNDKVYFFADAPHVLKLIRNWFLDTGFQFSDGRLVKKDPVVTLVNMEESQDLKICHKITKTHLTVQKADRQNVRKACELLSHTTATALKHHLANDGVAMSTSYFIELTNKWFDIMNSYLPRKYGEAFQKAYGQDLGKQNEILHEMLNVMTTMRCCGKQSLQLFQKGCAISILSLQNLYEDVRVNYDRQYILTHRINQDCLENLFSQIRTRGGLNDHPTPLEAIYRLRMIILGKTQGVLQKNTNTNNEDDKCETVVSNILRMSGVDVANPSDITIQSCTTDSTENYDYGTSSIEESCSSDMYKNALEYLCGWVTKKLKSKYPYLSENKDTPEFLTSPNDSWTKHLSYGGLSIPSQKWLEEAHLINKEFDSFHLGHISKEPGV